MKESLKTRFSRVWFWFLPAWCLPAWFFSLGALAGLTGMATALGLGGVLVFGSLIAARAKAHLSWGEFYLFYAAVPFAVLWLGMMIAVACARLQDQ